MSAKSCSSSQGTTPLRPDGGSAGWTWCFTPRNALFFRRRAPRLRDKTGLRRVERGASLPPMPCSSVDGHHVFGAKSDFGRLVVVLRSPKNLVLPSTGTTSLEQNRISSGWSWCFAPRKTTFFRRRAPRLWSKIGFRPVERGASLPRNALFFRRRAPRQRVPLNKKPASEKQSPFKLTLMKGDEAVEVLQVIAQNSLLGYTWNSYNCVSHKFFIKIVYCAASSK